LCLQNFNISINNQDLLRGSLETLGDEAVTKALLWLRGRTPYPYPTSIHLNLTLRCTARCLHCSQWTWPSHAEFTVNQLKKLFNIFRYWGVKTITFGGGNPLLYDHISQSLQLARRSKMQVGIISEGIRMPDNLVDIISQYAHWIRFSLDGPDSHIHDLIRNKPGLFDSVIECITKLKNHQNKLLIGINCVIQKHNFKYLSQMIDLAKKVGVDVLLFKIAHGEDNVGHFLPSLEDWKNVVEWVKSASKEKHNGIITNLNELCNLLEVFFSDNDVVQGKPVGSFYRQMQVHCFTPLFFLTCDSIGNMYPCDL
jgi:MoaA/NifB/PqqE/SkfB family radical SAM enzyme